MSEIDELIAKLKEWYPDEMVKEDLGAFERGRLVGQLEVVKTIIKEYERKDK